MIIFINAKILYTSPLELKNCKISVFQTGVSGKEEAKLPNSSNERDRRELSKKQS